MAGPQEVFGQANRNSGKNREEALDNVLSRTYVRSSKENHRCKTRPQHGKPDSGSQKVSRIPSGMSPARRARNRGLWSKLYFKNQTSQPHPGQKPERGFVFQEHVGLQRRAKRTARQELKKKIDDGVAQLARALARHARGRQFKSDLRHHNRPKQGPRS